MFSSPLPFSGVPVTGAHISPIQKTGARFKLSCCRNGDSNESSNNGERGFSFCQRQTVQKPAQALVLQRSGLCNCGRRHLLGTIASTLLSPSVPALGFEPESLPNSSYMVISSPPYPEINTYWGFVIEISSFVGGF